MNVPVWGEKIVHDNKVNLLPVGYLKTMESVELGEKCVGIVDDVLIVVLEDLSKELVLGVVDGFDDIFVISGEIEEAATFSRRSKLG